MSVVIETSVGDLTVDLFLKERPRACLNFLKLCKLKYYNYNLFHTIQNGFIAQTGDPTGEGNGGQSIWGIIEGSEKRFFEAEYLPKIRHSEPGLLSMVSLGDNMIGSQFFFTLGSDQTSLDGIHCVIGQVVEGLEVLRTLNEAICDSSNRPYKDIRITHTVILDDPFENPRGFREPSRSPSPSAERLRGGRIGVDEEIDDTSCKTESELNEMRMEREAKARATILEIVGDLPDAEIAPPENVLFVCKLNSVTTDDDLEIIFSRFGKVKGCEVIRDRKTGDSLQYAFVEFEDKKTCEAAYLKMDNVLIDDRRIHVDFSQSVSKLQWRGKGRGLIIKDGSKNNRIDFQNYKQPVQQKNYHADNRQRNDRRDEGRRNEHRRDEGRRDERNRDERRRDDYKRRSISPRRNESSIRDRRRMSPIRRDRRTSPERFNRRRTRSRSRSRNRYNRPDKRSDYHSYRRSGERERDNSRRNDTNYRDRSPLDRYRNDRTDRNEKNRNDDVSHRNETEQKSKRSHRSPSPEKDKPTQKKDKKSSKKSKKSKSKRKDNDKKHKKKKSTKKHKKHSSSSSSDSSSGSDSSSS